MFLNVPPLLSFHRDTILVPREVVDPSEANSTAADPNELVLRSRLSFVFMVSARRLAPAGAWNAGDQPSRKRRVVSVLPPLVIDARHWHFCTKSTRLPSKPVPKSRIRTATWRIDGFAFVSHERQRAGPTPHISPYLSVETIDDQCGGRTRRFAGSIDANRG